jgi:hypothetical protein
MHLGLIVLASLLVGCAAFDAPQPQILRDTFTVRIFDQGSLPPNVLGTAIYDHQSNTCVIVLRKYPQCLLHEIRHCVEGAWHGAHPTDEDC